MLFVRLQAELQAALAESKWPLLGVAAAAAALGYWSSSYSALRLIVRLMSLTAAAVLWYNYDEGKSVATAARYAQVCDVRLPARQCASPLMGVVFIWVCLI